jgi:hypothetical protein
MALRVADAAGRISRMASGPRERCATLRSWQSFSPGSPRAYAQRQRRRQSETGLGSPSSPHAQGLHAHASDRDDGFPAAQHTRSSVASYSNSERAGSSQKISSAHARTRGYSSHDAAARPIRGRQMGGAGRLSDSPILGRSPTLGFPTPTLGESRRRCSRVRQART